MNKTHMFLPGQVALAAFAGGPLAAGWLMRHNFSIFGKSKEARTVLVGGIIATMSICAVAFAFPSNGSVRMLLRVLPLLYAIALYQLVNVWQGDDLRQHQATEGQLGSWHATAGAALISLAVSMGFFATVVFLFTR